MNSIFVVNKSKTFMDKSQTHILVEKNGIESWMNKNVWEAIGKSSNDQGWVALPQAPIEVLNMKSNKNFVKAQVVEEQELEVDPILDIKEIKAKRGPKKK